MVLFKCFPKVYARRNIDVAFENNIYAGVAERQTRWFQVPVLRDVWVQIPSPAPRSSPRQGAALFFGAEQDRQITVMAICLSSGFEGSPVQSHSRVQSGIKPFARSLLCSLRFAKNVIQKFYARSPVTCTKKYCRKGYIFCSIFLSIAKAMAYHHALA